MAAGLGLGSAAVKELPGADRIHQEARSIIVGMIKRDYGPGAGAPAPAGEASARPPKTAYDRLSAFDRFTLDKRLQEAFSVPKLRAARGRGYDTGLSETIEVGRRTYQVSVTQVLVRRADGPGTATESGVGVDHQAKGSRGGSAGVERSVTFGPGAELAARIPRNAVVSADVGQFRGELTWRRETNLAMSTATKQYGRLRSPAGDVARPDYEARYQVTVTETRKPALGAGPAAQRAVSRIVQGDDVHLPAIVHPAFRPDEATASSPAYQAAYRDVVSTMGRTSRLTEAEYERLDARKIDFSTTGTAGLHAFVTGLGAAVREATDLVLSHTEADQEAHGTPDAGQGAPLAETGHPDDLSAEHVTAVEKALTEGFLRANLHRLLGPNGIPVPLPKEFHSGNPLRPNVTRSLTVRGFLVPAAADAGHTAAAASGETYVEDDTKLGTTKTKSHEWNVSASAGPVIKVGPTASDPAGGGKSASRRAVESRVGAAAGLSAAWTPHGTATSHTGGSIDLGVLTEAAGQHVSRAHLVLELTSRRHPVDSSWAGRQAGTIAHGADSLRPSARTTRLLIENATELSMSGTLHGDLQRVPAGDTSHLDPAPAPDRHVTRPDAAFAAGYPTRFDDTGTSFQVSVSRGPGQEDFTVGEGAGIVGAIRVGLSRSGLLGEQHLDDTSDTWRAISARFNAEELQNHIDDLRGVGVVHRAEVPGPAGSTRQVTIIARATSGPLQHVRSRGTSSVTFGGQALAQDGKSSLKSHTIGVTSDFYGIGTADNVGYGQAGVSLGREWEATTSSGSQTVNRDIRRSAAKGQGEEFASRLRVSVEIYSGSEWPEPLRRWPGALRPPASAPRPVVTIHSAHDPLPRTEPGDSSGPGAANPVIGPGTEPGGTAVAGPGGVAVRLVVPQHLTGPGPGPGPRAEPGAAAPAAEMGTGPTAVTPSAPSELDRALGDRFLPLHFPDLAQVAGWAPATTAGAGAAGHLGQPVPPPVREFAPTTDRAVWLNTALANRNARNNVRQIFGDGFPLSPDTGQPISLTARARVIRPVGPPADYSGLSFAERAEEPTYSQGSSRTWRPGLYSGGGTERGVGQPTAGPSWASGREAEGYNGDYVEYNKQFSQPAYSYLGDFSYEITGPHGYALRLDTGTRFEGLLLAPWARDLATQFPDHVVYPGATELPASETGQDAVVAAVAGQVTSAPTDAEPVRLFADPGAGGDVAGFQRAAARLAASLREHGLGGPVDLAVIRYVNGRPDHLEHFSYTWPSRHQAAIDRLGAEVPMLDASQQVAASELRQFGELTAAQAMDAALNGDDHPVPHASLTPSQRLHLLLRRPPHPDSADVVAGIVAKLATSGPPEPAGPGPGPGPGVGA
jgi:hypothetical protein